MFSNNSGFLDYVGSFFSNDDNSTNNKPVRGGQKLAPPPIITESTTEDISIPKYDKPSILDSLPIDYSDTSSDLTTPIPDTPPKPVTIDIPDISSDASSVLTPPIGEVLPDTPEPESPKVDVTDDYIPTVSEPESPKVDVTTVSEPELPKVEEKVKPDELSPFKKWYTSRDANETLADNQNLIRVYENKNDVPQKEYKIYIYTPHNISHIQKGDDTYLESGDDVIIFDLSEKDSGNNLKLFFVKNNNRKLVNSNSLVENLNKDGTPISELASIVNQKRVSGPPQNTFDGAKERMSDQWKKLTSSIPSVSSNAIVPSHTHSSSDISVPVTPTGSTDTTDRINNSSTVDDSSGTTVTEGSVSNVGAQHSVAWVCTPKGAGYDCQWVNSLNKKNKL